MKQLLAIPAVYRWFRSAIAGRFWEIYVQRYVRPQPQGRILDVGCGTGDILKYLPPVSYLGIDLDRRYIDSARKRFGSHGEFRCESATETVLREPESFDVVMANGVLHHLNDDEVLAVLRLARSALKASGHLTTLDGAFVPGQSRIARSLLNLDRGRFVRSHDRYVELARTVFTDINADVCHDLLRLPYTHLIMTCRP
jgi:SAM-dependent methyltransferase